MSVWERNDPRTTGAPGRTAWVRARPARASAVCWTSDPGTEAGDIAPMSRKGVMTTAWPAAA